MKIALERDVRIVCLDVLMDISKKSDKRADLVAVAKRAKELKGKITPEAVCTDLINRPEATSAGERILIRCQDIGILDGKYRLTEDGIRAAEEECVFIPERGSYRIWCTQDSLVSQKFLRYKRKDDGPIWEDVYPGNPKKKGKIDKTPKWVQDLSGKELQVYGTDEVVRIENVQNKCRLVMDPPPKLLVNLSVGQFESPQVTISSKKWKVDSVIDAPKLSFNDIWNNLLGNKMAKHWVSNFLELNYDDLSDPEKRSFFRDIVINKPAIKKYDTFKKTRLERIPISPRTKKDADKWASFLFENSINEYLSRDGYQSKFDEVKQNPAFYKFSDRLNLPEQQALAEKVRKENELLPREFWYLQAPLDLLPWGD
jgi:hypothetical protein